MQAQAAGGGGGGAGAGGGGSQSLLQNPKVQIAVIAVGAIALIVVIYVLFFSGSGGSSVPPATTVAVTPAAPAGAQGAAGLSPAFTGAPATSATPPVAGGAQFGTPPGAAAEGPARKGPGVPSRANPFEPNSDLRRVIGSIPPPPPPAKPPVFLSPEVPLYEELRPPEPPQVAENDNDGPPIPPMRVAGIVFGSQVSATLQIGDQYFQATPGKMLPEGNPIFRVDRVEQDRVILSRRWEEGQRKGVQRIEVALSSGTGSRGPTAGVFQPGSGTTDSTGASAGDLDK